jgi:hypothetical protein
LSESPIFQEEDQWFFWDETWTRAIGPFATIEEAVEALNLYVVELG